MALSARQVEPALPARGRWRRSEGTDWQPGDRGQLAVVAFSHMIQHSYVAVLGIIYPFALVEFHSSYAVLGAILSAAGLMGGLLQGAAGFVKRMSTRVLLSVQNLGMGLFSALGAIAPGMALFGAARVMGALTSWPQHPVGSAHVTERVPRRRGLALAVHTTGGNVGTLLAPIAAAAVVEAFGWRWALAGAGAVMALGSIVTWSGVRSKDHAVAQLDEPAGDGGPAAAAGSSSPADAPGESAVAPVTLRQALRRREAVAVLVAGIVSGAGRGVGVLATYVPAYLRTGLHKPALTVGLITALVSAGALIGPMANGHISDRVGRRPVLYTLYLCGALALGGFVLVGSSVLYLALVGLVLGAFTYSEQPIRQALFSDAMKGVSARKAFGAYFAISQSLGAVWIAILGVVITTSSFKAAFFVMGASFVAAAAIIAFGSRPGAAAS